MSLARGIQADGAAVDAGLILRWSTGSVEGNVTRVKLLKRQGYRARERPSPTFGMSWVTPQTRLARHYAGEARKAAAADLMA